MPALPAEIRDDPVLLSELDGREVQAEQLAAAKPTTDEHGEHRVVAPTTQADRWRCLKESLALLGRQPVANSDAELAHTLHSSDTRGEFWDEQTCICCFVGDSAHGGETEVDGRGGVTGLLEVDSVPKYHSAIECQSRFRAVPANKLGDRVSVASLSAYGCQAVQDGGLGLFQIWQL